MVAGGTLQTLSKIKTQLASATDLRDVREIRDKAKGIEQYYRASKQGLDVQNQAAEIRLRAERRMGELLKGMEKRQGARDGKRGNAALPQLADLGITKMQSSRSQRLADIPTKQFDRFFSEHDGGKEIYTKDLVKLAARQPKKVVSGNDSTEQGLVSSLEEVAGETFGTIYADPPWQYGNQSTRAATDNHYETMSVDDLCEMRIEDFAADSAHLHLWTTNAFLHDAFDVIDAWGFEYRSCFVWVKPQMGIGNYWRVSHEFLLLGIRGDAKRFADKTLKSWGEFRRGRHSAKPDAVRSFIEKASPGPYLELFGRRTVPGWTVFGNQVERMLC